MSDKSIDRVRRKLLTSAAGGIGLATAATVVPGVVASEAPRQPLAVQVSACLSVKRR